MRLPFAAMLSSSPAVFATAVNVASATKSVPMPSTFTDTVVFAVPDKLTKAPKLNVPEV